MDGSQSGTDEHVGPWDRDRIVTRTLIDAATATGRQPRWWVAPWVSAYFVSMVVSALADAPAVAYVLVTAALYPALCAGLHNTPRRADQPRADD